MTTTIPLQPTEIPDDGLWAIVDLVDGRRLAGYCRLLQTGALPGLEVDVPAVDSSPGMLAIHAARSVATVTPCTQVQAEAVALARRPAFGGPIHHLVSSPDRAAGQSLAL